jgi:cytochrome c553
LIFNTYFKDIMKLILTLILLCASSLTLANPFPSGNAQTGQKLFDQHKCNRCHAAMLGGDGSAIFTRPNRKVSNPAELLEQIDFCTGNIGVTLSAQDKQHLAAYLNRYYNLK